MRQKPDDLKLFLSTIPGLPTLNQKTKMKLLRKSKSKAQQQTQGWGSFWFEIDYLGLKSGFASDIKLIFQEKIQQHALEYKFIHTKEDIVNYFNDATLLQSKNGTNLYMPLKLIANCESIQPDSPIQVSSLDANSINFTMIIQKSFATQNETWNIDYQKQFEEFRHYCIQDKQQLEINQENLLKEVQKFSQYPYPEDHQNMLEIIDQSRDLLQQKLEKKLSEKIQYTARFAADFIDEQEKILESFQIQQEKDSSQWIDQINLLDNMFSEFNITLHNVENPKIHQLNEFIKDDFELLQQISPKQQTQFLDVKRRIQSLNDTLIYDYIVDITGLNNLIKQVDKKAKKQKQKFQFQNLNSKSFKSHKNTKNQVNIKNSMLVKMRQ